jgi:hypothetical protein
MKAGGGGTGIIGKQSASTLAISNQPQHWPSAISLNIGHQQSASTLAA